jgi:hypothetical protein
MLNGIMALRGDKMNPLLRFWEKVKPKSKPALVGVPEGMAIGISIVKK